MSDGNLIGARVAIHPQQCLCGKGRLGGRRGVVTGQKGGTVTVEFDRVGRERKAPVREVYAGWAVRLTPEFEAALSEWETRRGAPAGMDEPLVTSSPTPPAEALTVAKAA